MFSVAATSGRFERRVAKRLPTRTRDYLRNVALADFGCAAVGVFVAAQVRFVRFVSNVTSTYPALSLALPVLWIAALWLAGAYDVRFNGTGSDELRKVLIAGVSLTAAVAVFSYAINLELLRGYVVIVLPSVTVFDLAAGFAIRKRLHRQRAAGRCTHNVVAVGHELGKDGRPFKIYKFRIMVVRAEERKAELPAKNDSEAESCSSSAKIRASPWWGRTRAAGPCTSFRSFSTCSPATCHW
jgi:hypothetical protein